MKLSLLILNPIIALNIQNALAQPVSAAPSCPKTESNGCATVRIANIDLPDVPIHKNNNNEKRMVMSTTDVTLFTTHNPVHFYDSPTQATVNGKLCTLYLNQYDSFTIDSNQKIFITSTNKHIPQKPIQLDQINQFGKPSDPWQAGIYSLSGSFADQSTKAGLAIAIYLERTTPKAEQNDPPKHYIVEIYDQACPYSPLTKPQNGASPRKQNEEEATTGGGWEPNH